MKQTETNMQLKKWVYYDMSIVSISIMNCKWSQRGSSITFQTKDNCCDWKEFTICLKFACVGTPKLDEKSTDHSYS